MLNSATTDEQGTLADVNEDGNLDLISTSSGGAAAVNVSLGNGDGTFGTSTAYTTSLTGSGPLAVNDFNGDGNLDLLVMRAGNLTNAAAEASIRLGNGDGTFAAATTWSTRASNTNYNNREISVGDLDNDGDLDFVYTGSQLMTGTVYYEVQLNNGNGTFAAGTTIQTEASFGAGSSITLGDVNNDGNLDVGYGSSENDLVYVKLGNGNGTFGTAASYSAGTNPGEGVQFADLNRDGYLDLIVANDDNNVVVKPGNGDGTFGTGRAYSVKINDLKTGDMNGDGFSDVYGGANGHIYVLFGNGDGSLGEAIDTSGAGAATNNIDAGDINGDGALDIMMVGDDTVYTFLANTQSVTTMGYLNILTADDALIEIDNLVEVAERVQKELGSIGSSQSRLGSVIRVLQERRDQGLAAESRITDIDYAEETAEIVKLQILQDASSALFAQANVIPQVALALLK